MSTETLLEELFHTKIPITGDMRISVARYDGSTLILEAPLEPNVNDKGTAFGGSLFSLLVLSGWGLLHLKLREAGVNADVMIHRSSATYSLPVTHTIRARCELPDIPEYERFINDVRSRGRGTIQLSACIMSGARTAVEFMGNYVAKAASV